MNSPEFVPYLYPRKYKKDEVVFFRDDPSQALYIVKREKLRSILILMTGLKSW